jgi:tripartite-type tricarboxylate transporter receptor subunit TctC
VEKIAADVSAIVRSREVAERFAADGAVAVGNSPREFAAFLKSEMLKWGKVVRDAGITAD